MASVDIYQMTTKDTNHKVAPVTIFDAVVNPLNKKTLDQEFEDMVGAVDESVAVDDADATLVTTALRKTQQVLTLAEKQQARTNINAADADALAKLSTAVSENKTETDGKLSELGSKGIIALSYKAISNIIANLEVGEYGWNDSTQKLIKKVDVSGEHEIYTPDVNAGLYLYNGAYYRFNGNKLEAFAVQNNIFNSIILENGAIDSVGQLKDNSKRVRSANSLYGDFNIYIPNPSIVVYAVVYYTHEGTFDSYVQINDRFATNIGKDGCVAKLVFAHKDLSSNISAKDIKTALDLELLQDDIKTLQDDIKNLESELIKATIYDIAWEQGGINSANGESTDNPNRLRNKGFVYGNFSLTLPAGFHFINVCYYNEYTKIFDSYDSASSGLNVAKIGKEGCVARVAIAKTIGGTITIEELKNSTALENLSTKVNDLEMNATIHDIAWEQGGLNIAGGQETKSSTRIRNANYIMGAMRLTLPEHLCFLSVCYYDETTLGFVSYDVAMAGQSSAIIGKDGCVAKVAVAKKAGGNISIEDLKNSDALDVAYKQAIHSAPLAEFSYDHELKDVSRDIEDFTIRWAEATVMEQVYEHFDALCEAHPSYISKVDAAELAGLSYPVYANLNGVANETYLATPSYKTYLYKLIDNNANAGSVEGGVNAKRKLFIVGGTHGIEVAGCVNSYLFAKMLCEGKDVNYFKLRESYDIYILPCLNGYGIYHMTRVNANGVDINRNYPIKGWSSNGSVGDVDYTGDTAGSEFETQLIMALTSHINPDIAIDHHNYWPNLKWQFYTNVKKKEYVPLLYQSLVDCSYAFIKGLPSYFGNTPKLFLEGSGSSISGTRTDNSGTTLAWWDENGVKISSTLEICCGIGYMGGIHIEGEEGYDYYGADTFSIAEYTLRNQVLRFSDYCMKRL